MKITAIEELNDAIKEIAAIVAFEFRKHKISYGKNV